MKTTWVLILLFVLALLAPLGDLLNVIAPQTAAIASAVLAFIGLAIAAALKIFFDIAPALKKRFR
jgi:hypothetical protein